jgi:hypothetical protein
MNRDIASFFDVTGYYRSQSRIPDELVTRMRELIEGHLDGAVAPFRVNEHGEPCRIDHLIERDPVFLEALRSSAVREPMEAILGPTAEVMRHRHNHATRNAPGDIPFRLHRDVQQWSQPVVSVFIYLEDSNTENGCTTVVPATHRLPYAGPQSGGGGGNWADEHEEYRMLIGQELPIEMPRGGVLFVNALCFHSVGSHDPGRPGSTRLSTVFACRAADHLTRAENPDFVRIYGESRYLANDALPVSGSLTRGLSMAGDNGTV